jgi:hypothetical protein
MNNLRKGSHSIAPASDHERPVAETELGNTQFEPMKPIRSFFLITLCLCLLALPAVGQWRIGQRTSDVVHERQNDEAIAQQVEAPNERR